jgi:hypothetical protein
VHGLGVASRRPIVIGGKHRDLTDFLEGLLKGQQPGRINAVVVSDQDMQTAITSLL